MSLLDDAAALTREILGGDFSVAITVTSPDGETTELRGLAADIGQTIDPETGVMVAGRRASVALSLADLADAGIGQPAGIASETRAPWLVEFRLPASSKVQRFKVTDTAPDRLGCLVCYLEVFGP